MPVSLACLCCSLRSSCSCNVTIVIITILITISVLVITWRFITSSLVAGVELTDWRHSFPSSSHSRGGRMLSRISCVSS